MAFASNPIRRPFAETHAIDPTLTVLKFGRNPDCDQKASVTAVPVGRDVWDGGIAGAAAWVPPTAARIHAIVSTNDEDGGAGTDTGALTLRVFGLDDDYALAQEDVILNGTTPKNTVGSYRMIHRMVVLTAGSAGRNLGSITATAAVDSTVTAKVSIDNNQTLMAIYQVPADHTAHMTHWHGSLNKAGGGAILADFALMSKDIGGVWRVRGVTAYSSGATSSGYSPYSPAKIFAEKTLIKVVCNPSADAQDVSAGFDMELVRN